MRLDGWNCASLVSTAQRARRPEVGIHGLSRRLSWTGSANVNKTQPGLLLRQTHALCQQRFCGTRPAGQLGSSWISSARAEWRVVDVRASPKLSGRNQLRCFKSSSTTTDKAGKERTEELLQQFEVKKGEETRPQRQALNKEDEGSHSALQEKQGPQSMNKGRDSLYSRCYNLPLLIVTGKLLTTPSRLFKLIIPLTNVDNRGRGKGESQHLTILEPALTTRQALNP